MKNSILSRHQQFSEERIELGVPAEIYPYSAGITGGLLGGLAMIIPALVYGFVSGHGPWYPVNLIAATVLPGLQAASPSTLELFNPLYLSLGLAIHILVATGLGLTFAILLPILPGPPQVWALVVGPLLWLGATSMMLPTLNPIMSRLIDWPSFAIANIVYGIVMGMWVEHTPKVPAERA